MKTNWHGSGRYFEVRLAGLAIETALPPNSGKWTVGDVVRDLSTGVKYQIVSDRLVENGLSLVWELLTGGSVYQSDDLHLYIDAVNGDDANSGLSADEAIQTIPELKLRLPALWGGVMEVHWASGTYTWPSGFAYDTIFFIGERYNPAGATMKMRGTYEVVAGPLTATGGDNASLNSDDLGAPGEYRLKIVRFLSGENEGALTRVAQDDGDTLIFIEPLEGSVAEGDTFEIVEPGVVIDTTARPATFTSSAGDRSELQWSGGFRFFGGVQFDSSTLILRGVDFDTQGQQVYFRQRTRVDIEEEGVAVYGVDGDGIGGTVNTIHYSQLFGKMVASDTGFLMGGDSRTEFYFVDCERCAFSSDGSTLFLAGFGDFSARMFGMTEGMTFNGESGGPFTPTAVVTVANSSYAPLIFGIDFEGSDMTAISVTDHSDADLVFNKGETVKGAGIALTFNATAYLDGNEVTGPEGDILMEETEITYEQVDAVPGITDTRGNTVANFALPP